MKPLPEETYKDWCHRVQMFEQGHAMMQIAQGKDPDVVLETMSRRIMDKLLHPIFKAIRDTPSVEYDAEANKESYKRQYLDKNPHGIADHVESNT